MEITEVRVALREQAVKTSSSDYEHRAGETRLKAYATLTFDRCFVVRNIKVIEGRNGLFVAMPSHKPKIACERCHFKNDVGGHFCSQCGTVMPRAPERTAPAGESGLTEAQAHRDIAHPITAEFRQYLQQKVLEAYETERMKAQSFMSRTIDEAHDESL